ncbi:MAG: hypothetical protein EBW66_06120 [Actinobacteria bacterium]|nr:hypothetical protein [Actinomycetota bacterium]
MVMAWEPMLNFECGLRNLGIPFLLQAVPAFGALAEKAGSADKQKMRLKQITSLRFTASDYPKVSSKNKKSSLKNRPRPQLF